MYINCLFKTLPFPESLSSLHVPFSHNFFKELCLFLSLKREALVLTSWGYSSACGFFPFISLRECICIYAYVCIYLSVAVSLYLHQCMQKKIQRKKYFYTNTKFKHEIVFLWQWCLQKYYIKTISIHSLLLFLL